MKKYIILSMLCTWTFVFHAQLKGVVYGHTKEGKKILENVKIKSLSTNDGTYTNEEGIFEIILSKKLPDTLLFIQFGFITDTLIVDNSFRFANIEVNLYSDQLLPEVVVKAKFSGHGIHKMQTLQVEHIGENELKKAACCNLSESFETNASVDVNMTDAVSGAKKIQMMGLDGVYTQIQMENIPYLRGLESSFGMNSIPGTWVESIQITKGTGNVVNGYESMAGLINIELKKPEEIERFYVNTYANNFGRTELNLHGGDEISNKWKSALFVHGARMQNEIDNNKDGFRDIPLSNNLSFLNRWRYDGKRFEAQIGANVYYENKNGGQLTSSRENTNMLYGVFIENRHADIFAKTGFLFPKKPYQSIGVVYNLKWHENSAQFGNRNFTGQEKRGYVNAIFDNIIGTTIHKYRTGLSFVYADINQELDSIKLPRIEYVPGAFFEYTFTKTRATYVIGLRGDYHNLFAWQFSPRIHGKYSITENFDFRFTAGRGFRVPNQIIDNISLLATSRSWIIENNLKAEVSWNLGGSIVKDFYLGKRKGSLTMDYYYTFFENQLVIDRDRDHQTIYFTNLAGKSSSQAFQTELSIPLIKGFDIRLAYKNLNIISEFGGIKQQQIMIPKHRGFVNLAYTTRNKRWEYDLTTSVYGKSRLHEVKFDDGSFSSNNESSTFYMINAQITYIYKKLECYLGGENLANYRLQDAIVEPDNPFGSNFDATRAWAPIQGITIYAGLRYNIDKKKKN